jgi:hypothetical protein
MVPNEINHRVLVTAIPIGMAFAAGGTQQDDAAVQEGGAHGTHYFAAANGRQAVDAGATLSALGRVTVE